MKDSSKTPELILIKQRGLAATVGFTKRSMSSHSSCVLMVQEDSKFRSLREAQESWLFGHGKKWKDLPTKMVKSPNNMITCWGFQRSNRICIYIYIYLHICIYIYVWCLCVDLLNKFHQQNWDEKPFELGFPRKQDWSPTKNGLNMKSPLTNKRHGHFIESVVNFVGSNLDLANRKWDS